MKDFIKRMALTGIGFASMGKDKIEEMARDISQNMGLSEDEGRKVAEEILDETRKARDDVEKNSRETANRILEKMDLPTKQDITKLENRIKELESKIESLNKS